MPFTFSLSTSASNFSIAGIFFGLMFGFSGIGAALLGLLADNHGIEYVYKLCSFLPLVGILTVLLPSTKGV